MTNNESRLWTTQDVAKFLGVPVQTVYRWRTHGEGPAGYKIGKHVRFDPDTVRPWVAQRADQR